MNCPHCGTANAPTAQSCARCMMPLTNDQEEGLIDHPPGFKANVFPREHLIVGEEIQWEGKPSLIAFILGPAICLIAGLLLFISFNLSNGFLPNFLKYMGLLIFFYGLICVLIGFVRWWNTAFAMTNRRIMSQYGVFTTKYADCSYDKIQNSVIIRPFVQNLLGYGQLVFSTAGISGGINSKSANKFMSNGGGIFWNALPQPVEVKKYVEKHIESTKMDLKKADYKNMATVLNDVKVVEPKTIPGPIIEEPNDHSQSSMEERLVNANYLKDKNLITKEEYEQMRKKILGEA